MPYRNAAYQARAVVTRSVGGPGWPVGAAGLVLIAIGYVSFAQRNDEVRLECPPASEACVVTKPSGETVRIPEYSAADVMVAERDGVTEDGTFMVRLGAYTDVPLRTRENAHRFANAFREHHNTNAGCQEVFRVGKPPRSAPLFAGLGVACFALLALWRGKYRFVRDDRRGVLRVERARGFVPRSVVELPVGDVEEIVAVSYRPDKAFARYAVVLRTRAGDDVLAFPSRLNAREAFAVASAASALLTDEEATPVGPR